MPPLPKGEAADWRWSRYRRMKIVGLKPDGSISTSRGQDRVRLVFMGPDGTFHAMELVDQRKIPMHSWLRGIVRGRSKPEVVAGWSEWTAANTAPETANTE